jgi:cell division protease FtsH
MFGEISTGALSDLEKVTKQAQAIVTIYGLNERIGNVSYYDSSGRGEYSFGKPYSERTAQIIDEEISKVIEEAYTVAKNVLIENKDKLTMLAEELLEKEVIFNEDLVKIFGIKPGNDIPEPETKKVESKVTDETEDATEVSDGEIDSEGELQNNEETTITEEEKTKTEENNA